MTAREAHRAWFAACTDANQIPPGHERDAAMVEVFCLRDAWRDAITAEADARARTPIMAGPMFPMHTPHLTPRAPPVPARGNSPAGDPGRGFFFKPACNDA